MLVETSLGKYRGVVKDLQVKCLLCSSNNKVEIHHRDGNKRNNTTKNLLTLCRKCHRLLHSIKVNEVDVSTPFGEKISVFHQEWCRSRLKYYFKVMSPPYDESQTR